MAKFTDGREYKWQTLSEYMAWRKNLKDGGLVRDVLDQDIWDNARLTIPGNLMLPSKEGKA